MAILWQHEETRCFTWTPENYPPSSRYFKVPIMYEDELPESMSDKDYNQWYDVSAVIDGVRMGPKI